MKRFSWMFLLALTAGSASLAMAQDAATTAAPAAAPAVTGALPAGGPGPRVKMINSRLMEQGGRIKQGVKSGTLTKETAQPLWAQVKAIRAQEKADMVQNGTRSLTDDQLASLTQMLDANSKAIYDAKHPAGAASTGTAATTDTASAPSTDTTADPDSDSSN